MEIKVCLSVHYFENMAQGHIPVLWKIVHRRFGYHLSQDCPVFLADHSTAALSPFFEGRNRKGERACNHFFYNPLLPTFGAFEIIRFRLSNIWNVNEWESFSNFSRDYFVDGLSLQSVKRALVSNTFTLCQSLWTWLSRSLEQVIFGLLACLDLSVIDHNTINIPEIF